MGSGGSNRALSAEEVAERFGIHVDTLRRNYRKWGIPSFKVGRSLRFLERNIEAYEAAQHDKAA